MTSLPRLFLPAAVLLWFLASRIPLLLPIATNLGLAALAACSAYWILSCTRSVFFNGLMDANGKSVLITGCDTGFGNVLATQLACEGFFVYAGCLNGNGYCAERLREHDRIQVLQLDVTKEDEIWRALETVESTLDEKVLWAVVANAGVSSIGYIEWQPRSRVQSVFDVNTFGALSVATAFLPLLKKAQGRLIFVTSFLGSVTVPECLAYCMSKQACSSLADGIRRQYFNRGVQVSVIAPGAYRTPMNDHAKLCEVFDRDLELLPERVRRCINERSVVGCKHRADVLHSAFTRNDLQEVVDSIKMAVRHRLPQAYYRPGGWLDGILRSLHDITPAEIADEAIEGARYLATMTKRK